MTGFFSGLLIGAVFILKPKSKLNKEGIQIILGCISISIIVLAWGIVFLGQVA
jgi:hypothetical protein